MAHPGADFDISLIVKEIGDQEDNHLEQALEREWRLSGLKLKDFIRLHILETWQSEIRRPMPEDLYYTIEFRYRIRLKTPEELEEYDKLPESEKPSQDSQAL